LCGGREWREVLVEEAEDGRPVGSAAQVNSEAGILVGVTLATPTSGKEDPYCFFFRGTMEPLWMFESSDS